MKALSTVAMCAALSGCGLFTPKTITEYVPVNSPPEYVRCGAEPQIDIITATEVLPEGCAREDSGEVVVCITASHYENLAIYLQEVIARVDQGNSVILFYRDCVTHHNDHLREVWSASQDETVPAP